MNLYRITNTRSGAVLGIYEGEDDFDALDAMARESGYADYAHCNEAVPATAGEIKAVCLGPKHKVRRKGR